MPEVGRCEIFSDCRGMIEAFSSNSHNIPGFPLDDGGSDITSYKIEKKEVPGEGEWQVAAIVPDPRTFGDGPFTSHSTLAHSISQLSPGETYQFRVTAENGIGVCL